MGKYTLYNHAQNVEKHIYSVFRTTIMLKRSCDEHIQAIKKVNESHSYSKLTQYYQGKMHGIKSVLFGEIQTGHVVWCHVYTNRLGNKKQVFKWEQMPRYIRFDTKKFESSFFWKTDLSKKW